MHATRSRAVCFTYGFIFFCTSLIHNIFLVYHVQAFVSGFGLSKFSFWVAELIFLVWNAVNDPLFGWIFDKQLLQQTCNDIGVTIEVVRRRARIISMTGPFLALTFFLTWFSNWMPHYPGCRFALVLCAYDTAVTILDLQKGALLADLAVSQVDRSRLGSAASIGQALSASGLVIITWWMGSSLENFEGNIENATIMKTGISQNFQLLATLLAAFSGIGLWLSGRWLSKMDFLFSGKPSIG